MAYQPKYNLDEQLERDINEALKLNKTPTGQWWYIPRQRLKIHVRKGYTLRQRLENILRNRHNMSKLKEKDITLKDDIRRDAYKRKYN
jgi:hypothetical protein